jgi:hypothetical protein
MSGVPAEPTSRPADAPSTGRFRLYLACFLSAVLFAWVCWGWLAPADPMSAVAFVNHGQPWLMLVLVVGLSSAVAGLAAILMPSQPYCGALVVAVGWAVLRLRAAGIDSFLFDWAPSGMADASRRVPYIYLMIETAGWAAVGLMTLIVCGQIESLRRRSPDGPSANPSARQGSPAWWNLYRTVLCAAVAIVVICLVMGPITAEPEAGQALFAIGLGFFLGTLLAMGYRLTQVAEWCFLAVPIVALIGYALAWYQPGLGQPFTSLSNPVPNPLAKALPVDYLAAGLAGCILARWTIGTRESAKTP